MKNVILSITALLISTGCSKDVKQTSAPPPVPVTNTIKPASAPAKRFEPAHKSSEIEGTVTLNNNLYTVVTAFTDAIAFKQEAINLNGQPELLYYREKLVHLINGKDTLTLNKALFKKQLPDYDSMILQGMHLNFKLKTGTFPLLVYFCMPESDYCYYFDISINLSGEIVFKEVEEDEY